MFIVMMQKMVMKMMTMTCIMWCPLEMVECMKRVAAMDTELSIEERNLLSVAYKNVIGARRASWRIISSIEQKEESKGAEVKLELIRQYRKQVSKSFLFLLHFQCSQSHLLLAIA